MIDVYKHGIVLCLRKAAVLAGLREVQKAGHTVVADRQFLNSFLYIKEDLEE